MKMYCSWRGDPPRRVYCIETETGETVARFDELYIAAIVLRYLKGGTMNGAERKIALSALMECSAKEGR